MGGSAGTGGRAVALTAERARRRLASRVARTPLLARLRDDARERALELWVVGGWVRDTLRGAPAKDFDLVATGDTDRWRALFRERWGTRGFRFAKRGVVTWRLGLDDREVDLVDAGAGELDRDLKRRDLTVNAIAFELGSGRIEDPCGGLGDLARRRLRQPRSGVFDEDPLRALRLARFLARLPGFSAAPATLSAARRVLPALGAVAIERVTHELDALLAAERPVPGLRAMAEWGLIELLLPELSPLARCTAGGDRPDVWSHTLLAIEASASLRRRRLPFAATLDDDGRRVLHWALLLHDISKPETLRRLPDGRPSFHGHETLGAERAQALLLRLRAPGELIRRVERLVRLHLRPGHLADAGPTPRALARLVRDAGEELPLLALHAAADALGSGATAGEARFRRLRRVLVALEQMAGRRPSDVRPLLDGHEVMRLSGVAAGPALGVLLGELVEAQIAGEVDCAESARAWLLARQ